MTTTALPIARCSTLLAALAIASNLTAQTTAFVPCVLDNTLYQTALGDLSNGKGPSVFVGLTAGGRVRRAVMKFDVAGSLPAGAKILSTTLILNVVQTQATQPTPATGHRLTQGWGEGSSIAGSGGGGGALAANGDATWIHAFYPNVAWATAGGDFDPTPSFTMAMPTSGVGLSDPSLQAAIDVQLWLDNPAQNFGWLLKLDEIDPATARRIDSREAPTSQPVLSVSYLLPGQVGTVGVGCPVGSGTFGDAIVGTPNGGATIQLVQSNAPPSTIGANLVGLAVEPGGFSLLPGCTYYLPLAQPIYTQIVFLTDAAGSASTSVVLPTGFPGVLVSTQAFALDNSPLGFTLSNAAVLVMQ